MSSRNGGRKLGLLDNLRLWHSWPRRQWFVLGASGEDPHPGPRGVLGAEWWNIRGPERIYFIKRERESRRRT